MFKTYKIIYKGQVQGVGFRPFVYSLTERFHILGTVSNNEDGVVIYASGLKENIVLFYHKILDNPPNVAKINHHSKEEISFRKYKDFQIIPSEKSGKLNLPLTPDFAICTACKNEISDTENRRYQYPFTTCVHCGPRWALTETFPFERNNTSIDDFPMCAECLEEYTKPTNRRFHSQTNTCHYCGIELYVTDNSGDRLIIPQSTLFKQIAAFLSEGKILAIKNTSGYLLCCNAEDKEVVQKLRAKKKRPNKPFAVLYPSLEFLKTELNLDKVHINALSSTERPITIIPFRKYNGNIAIDDVAPGLRHLGVMLPHSGILQLLANELNFPIVATSGNLHGSPIISENDDALDKLNQVADYFLQHDLRITHPQDDSVVTFSSKCKQEVLFRRSRGYAPNYFNAPITSEKKILALGAHLKSCISYYPNAYLYVSQYLGNLDNYDVYNRFTKTVSDFITLFEQQPDVVLVDAHHGYQSARYGIELANKLNTALVKIQHHKAHFASVLGEHRLFENDETMLGVIWDGTGYGDDGHIWGGEFFSYQSHKIDRISHFEYFDWLAGDKMSREPKLSLFSLSGNEMLPLLKEKFSDEEIVIYQTLKEKNKLKTSSVGRLFDAVASLLNICDINSYEGDAAILLENYITDYQLENCSTYCSVLKDNSIPTKTLLNNLYSDYKKGTSKEQIIINFFYTLATLVLEVARLQNIKSIACSGGVFQNTSIVDMIREMAEDKFRIYFNRNLSPNDENISFGQIMYYLHCS